MMRNGKPFVSFNYKDVFFILFRNDGRHYLCAKPTNMCHLDVIIEINTLLACCRKEIVAEMDKWDAIRLCRDDNESDPIC